MARQYYYVVASLPELNTADRELPWSPVEFREAMREHLHPRDFEWLRVVYLSHDNRNLLSVVREQDREFDPAGNYSAEELQAGLDQPELLPSYMARFLDENRADVGRIEEKELEKRLLDVFADWQRGLEQPFLRAWYSFDNDIRNILAALNSRKHGLELAGEVVGGDDDAAQIRANPEHDFGLASVLDHALETVAVFDNAQLYLREVEFERMRWRRLWSSLEPYPFGVEQILGYAIALHTLERAAVVQATDGQARLESILQDIKTGHELPESFR